MNDVSPPLDLAILGGRRGIVPVAGAPEGYDALIVARMATEAAGRPILHVARDDARLALLREGLAFFAPDLDVLALPAWDCLPYDRVSPNGEIVSRRVEALSRLAQPRDVARALVVLTTVNAILQRVPPRAFFAAASLHARVGERLPLDRLVEFFRRNGYLRADTVREPGEFAVRGGIVDAFPPGTPEPVRLDFFGDELEGIRSFDAVSQLTTGKRGDVVFLPVSELDLDEGGVQRFRQGYRTQFGADQAEDPLYEAVSAGRRYAGMEHWLPLFHERLETVVETVGGDAILTLDHQALDAASARLEQISEYFDARRSMSRVGDREEVPSYKPLPPDALYLAAAEWDGLLGSATVASFSPFAAPGGLDAGGRPGRDFAEARTRREINLFEAVGETIVGEAGQGRTVIVAGYSEGSRDRLAALLKDHGLQGLAAAADWRAIETAPAGSIFSIALPLERGFQADGLVLLAEQDILGDRLSRPAVRRRRRGEQFIQEASSLAAGDYVVHAEHGIGQYDGLETLDVAGAPHDCLRLLYSGGDKLYVPVENIDMLSRYGSEDAVVVLDKLGGAAWQARKARVKKRIRDIAEQLIRLAAERELRHVEPLAPVSGIYEEFCARFPYAETEDQQRAIDETLADLAAGRPMDRLICGDVGFGKTEVALRAAMIVAMSGLQVAVVVPTTLLARQHAQVFAQRFDGLPVRIAQLSRLVSGKEAAEIKKGLATGEVDIVIGTHAVLAKTITFGRLGLVVVDEEQHFGVAQKERLKELKANVHVLTMTATPIPRTLQMALTGVREMSVIATPPVDRLAVRTFVLPYDGVVVREAILRERYRGGQTFYVCPRIEDLPRVAERLQRLVPEIKFQSAHGQMAGSELERIMTAFCDGQFDLLLSTNIVESGLDIPAANTLIVHRADMFGLAQLYQLRGRVGRSKTRAYAYLTLHPTKILTETAKRRLEVMQTLDSLGAGFSLASHDMDIRGAGNLLGEEQSGHVREVGIELYQELLQEAVAAARDGGAAGAAAEEWTPHITIGMPVLIPESYVEDLSVRLSLYRRLASLVDQVEIDAFGAEMIDRFGPLPAEVENLLRVIAIKQLCRRARVDKVDAGPKGAVLSFHRNQFPNPEGLVRFIASQAGTVNVRPDQKLVYRRAWDDPESRLRGLHRLLQEITQLAA